ncbi:hypothetical protein PoB_000914800 [Plakobranchus ocellatus]|uniref:Uncharacterized protein n=1 Tax=Plakobranchus ocellatus TaxID=259542 RepID=A0AAV3YKA2_9GAST|nr:hypothetical protein PoB_000914800 [Plakobranchus ocellatus]
MKHEGVGRTVGSKSAIRFAGTFMSLFRALPPAPQSDLWHSCQLICLEIYRDPCAVNSRSLPTPLPDGVNFGGTGDSASEEQADNHHSYKQTLSDFLVARSVHIVHPRPATNLIYLPMFLGLSTSCKREKSFSSSALSNYGPGKQSSARLSGSLSEQGTCGGARARYRRIQQISGRTR